MLIHHLALRSDWEAAQEAGEYRVSTLGRSLDEVGYVHGSHADQWEAVRARFYSEVSEPLVLLDVDTDLLTSPVREEPAVPGGTELFPHVYGPLDLAAVVAVHPLG